MASWDDFALSLPENKLVCIRALKSHFCSFLLKDTTLDFSPAPGFKMSYSCLDTILALLMHIVYNYTYLMSGQEY